MSNKFDIDWLQTQGFLKTLLIFIWWNEPRPTLSLIFLTSCRSCPTNKIQSWRILKGWQLTSISLCSSVYCWHPVTRRAEELGWQPQQSSFRKLILFVNISAAACSRTRSRCQCANSTFKLKSGDLRLWKTFNARRYWKKAEENIHCAVSTMCPPTLLSLEYYSVFSWPWPIKYKWLKFSINWRSYLLKAGKNTQLSSSLLSYMRGWSVTR